MTIKKITIAYILFLTFLVVGFDSNLMPKPYQLAKHFAPLAELAQRVPHRIPHDDKLAHFFLVGALALCVNLSLSLSSFSVGKRKILKGSLFLLIFVTFEEASQMLFPWRSFSLADLFANYAGIFCFGRAAIYLSEHKASILPRLPRVFASLFQDLERREASRTLNEG